MSELDRSDWVSSPYTKDLVQHLEAGKLEIGKAMGNGQFACDTVDATAQGYANAVGRVSMISLALDYIKSGPSDDEYDSADSGGNVAESYNDGL